MKITIRVPRPSPSLEPELLIRFVMRELSETIEPESTEPPPIVLALTLAAVSRDRKFHDRLKEQVISSSDKADEILGMCEHLFMPVLRQIGCGQTLDDPDISEENPLPDESTCEQVLRYALSEGKRILVEKDYEFGKVFEVLTRTGLSCYSFRLAQFAEVCESFKDDPISLVRRGIEIMQAITLSSPNEN